MKDFKAEMRFEVPSWKIQELFQWLVEGQISSCPFEIPQIEVSYRFKRLEVSDTGYWLVFDWQPNLITENRIQEIRHRLEHMGLTLNDDTFLSLIRKFHAQSISLDDLANRIVKSLLTESSKTPSDYVDP